MDSPETYNQLYAICQARRARRVFAEQPLSEDQIEKILGVAYTSPYASGRKNWEVQVVTDPSVLAAMAAAVQVKIAEIRGGIRADFAADFAAYATNFLAFAQAPALFIPTFRIAPTLSLMVDSASDEIARWERDNYLKSISCVGMLTLLAAESLGLAACYMTGPLLAEKEIGELIKLKRGRNIGALIPVGHRTGED